MVYFIDKTYNYHIKITLIYILKVSLNIIIYLLLSVIKSTRIRYIVFYDKYYIKSDKIQMIPDTFHVIPDNIPDDLAKAVTLGLIIFNLLGYFNIGKYL
jgi:hypothetical protein